MPPPALRREGWGARCGEQQPLRFPRRNCLRGRRIECLRAQVSSGSGTEKACSSPPYRKYGTTAAQDASASVGILEGASSRDREGLSVLDIVEIALDTLTDFTDFEKLACEVLHNNGFPDIQPLGGVADSGQDAVVERFYYKSNKRTRTVFQITTQETIESKLRSTIARLDETETDYTSLHVVSSRPLTTARRSNLTKIAQDLDVTLSITDREALQLVLADYSNGIFHRHFPDPERQIEEFHASKEQKPIGRERVLRMAMAFTSLPEADRARKQILRELALALLVSMDSGEAGPKEIGEAYQGSLATSNPIQVEQFTGALDYWVREGLVKKTRSGTYNATAAGKERAARAEMLWERRGAALASDLADAVEEATGTELDSGRRGLVERNGVDVITEMFRLFGLELASQLLGDTEARGAQIGSHEAIVATAERDLSEPLGEVLTAALGELLAHPNTEQAETLNALALGYLGASLVQVDPAVRELQATRFRDKTFVLDTDFLLDCIVTHQPRQRASLELVRSLCGMGAKIIVPDACVKEAADHASIARRTVDYFGERLFGLSETQATQKINNIFAQGWYFKVQSGSRTTFWQFLQNYYEPNRPEDFMAGVVAEIFPEEIEIGEVASILGINLDRNTVDRLKDALIALLQNSRKRDYRSQEEIATLATTDAELYAAVRSATEGLDGKRGALTRRCYLVTSSKRFLRASERALGKEDQVSARPDTLTGLLALIGQSDVNPKDFMALFDNPLLQASVAKAWPDTEELLNAGLSLRDKSQARLAWDLEEGLHQRIAAVATGEAEADASGTETARRAVDTPIIGLLEEARGRKYRAMPYAETLIKEVEPLRADNARLTEELDALGRKYQELESEIGMFNRRRQRYLRRVAQGENRRRRR